MQAIRKICEEPPTPLDLDADLQTIIAKALEKEPNGRYQSAAALAEDVERYLDNQPILAHPPSTIYHLKKLIARHRGMVTAAGVIAVLLVALGVTMVVQAGRVRREGDRATAEAAKASAINAFLLDALGAADPWLKGSRNVSLLDALRQAQDRAKTSFVNQPLIEASVLQTIGTTFSNLAEFPEAEKPLKTSLDLRVKAAGPRVPRPRSRSPRSRRCTRSRRSSKRPRSTPARRSRSRAGFTAPRAWRRRRRCTTSPTRTPGAERSRARRRPPRRCCGSCAGPPPWDSAEAGRTTTAKVETNALLILLQAFLAEEDFEKTLAMGRERLALARKRLGDRHPEIAQALNDVALGQLYTGNLAGAERSYLEAIDLASALLGEEHPELAAMRENLGNVYFRQGQLDKTATNLEVVLAMRRKALGDDSEPVARTLANIGTVYKRAGNDEAAVKNYREAVERLSAKLGPEHPDVGTILLGMGDSLRKLEKYSEAEAALKRSLDIHVKALGEGNAATQRMIKVLATLYTAWKKPAEAAAYTARLKPVEAGPPAATAK